MKQADPFAQAIRAGIDESLRQLQDKDGFEAGAAALQAQFDKVIAYGDPADKELFRQRLAVNT